LNQKEKIKLKQQLKETCASLLEKRIYTALQAMKLAQESANEAEKSSAGDKYETSRTMGQLDRDMNSKQLQEAKKELAWLQAIDTTRLYDRVASGAFVACRESMYFVAAGLGVVTLDERMVVLLSPKAPLTAMMTGKKAGDSFTYNGKSYEITEIF
jgi:transcription elongation GreA/GreB family factor